MHLQMMHGNLAIKMQILLQISIMHTTVCAKYDPESTTHPGGMVSLYEC